MLLCAPNISLYVLFSLPLSKSHSPASSLSPWSQMVGDRSNCGFILSWHIRIPYSDGVATDSVCTSPVWWVFLLGSGNIDNDIATGFGVGLSSFSMMREL
ncbi:hypothetical protein EDD15DRAFT_2226753 [Pisolithus albus]|nr:hypothetical protein EDD15DRAFT_2226753 [Pisolithus albus]